jgi:hypothetical protein
MHGGNQEDVRMKAIRLAAIIRLGRAISKYEGDSKYKSIAGESAVALADAVLDVQHAGGSVVDDAESKIIIARIETYDRISSTLAGDDDSEFVSLKAAREDASIALANRILEQSKEAAESGEQLPLSAEAVA